MNDLPFISMLVSEIARERNITLTLDPSIGSIGRLERDGTVAYFRNAAFDLNPLGASEIVKDKDRTHFFLHKFNIPTVETKKVYKTSIAHLYDDGVDIETMIAEIEQDDLYPVFVKPNKGHEGNNVSKVFSAEELREAAQYIFQDDTIMLVQPVLEGEDYRFIVLDGEVKLVYRKEPLAIVGDGHSTIESLFFQQLVVLQRIAPHKTLASTDYRIARKLSRMGYTLSSVIPTGETVYLLDNANLSTGGTAEDVTSVVHEELKAVATHAAREFGLRFVGVDMMVRGDANALPHRNYAVLELNAKPGMRFFASLGRDERGTVKAIYEEAIETMLNGRS